jgi:glycosyltransferase involved in cell wall biosynthesis
MKVFTLAPGENWICDRFAYEWESYNRDISTKNILDADIIWLIAGWCWNHVPSRILKDKKVILTIHHIVSEKLTDEKIKEFIFRDRFVDLYHVPCDSAADQVRRLTKKPIFIHPFWANQNIWFEISNKEELRKKYHLVEKYAIGSFQRDTEGSDLISPKLEKGPDIFCDLIENMNNDIPNLHVMLAGWRRQYVINRLKQSNISFSYLELPSLDVINELYNCLDLYIVSARCEGGPQSIIECALTKTPIVSTDVGLASSILSRESIFDDSWCAVPDVEFANNSVQYLKIPNGFKPFIKTLSGMV